MSTPRTSNVRLSDAERRRHALQLRRDGASYDKIARTLGADERPLYSSKQAAHRAVRTALREINVANATELRGIELLRLEYMHEKHWLRATQPVVSIECDECGHTVDLRPDYAAVDVILKTMKQRAALVGLDARHGIEERAVRVSEEQARQTHRAVTAAMTEAGLSREVQQRVLSLAGQYLREHEDDLPEDGLD